jgi:hypothetical protein
MWTCYCSYSNLTKLLWIIVGPSVVVNKTSLVASMVCMGFGWLCWFCEWLLHHNWPPKSRSNIRTLDHALTHDHALLHHHCPKSQRFEPTAMHYTTIDPQKVRYSTTRPCTTPPLTAKNSRFEPTTMHYTTIDIQNVKDSNPRPCTSPLTQKGRNILSVDIEIYGASTL